MAHAAFPKGHPSLTLRDHLGTMFQDEDFATLCPAWGSPGLPPWRLALVTIRQLRANLADRHAAEAVRARIDWQYLLSLELTAPGFDFSVLSALRDRLLAGRAESLLVDKRERCRTRGLSKRPATHRLDPCWRSAMHRLHWWRRPPHATRWRLPRLAASPGAPGSRHERGYASRKAKPAATLMPGIGEDGFQQARLAYRIYANSVSKVEENLCPSRLRDCLRGLAGEKLGGDTGES